MPRSKGRSGRPYERLKARVFREESHCWRCHRWVDQGLEPRTPWSRSLDHVIPLHLGGPPLARWNARLAHIRCNSSRGARVAVLALPVPSRDWLGTGG
jgi:5-methylcytosine-specific restriction endonuclease McrA